MTMNKEASVPSARGKFAFRSNQLTSGTVNKDNKKARTKGYV